MADWILVPCLRALFTEFNKVAPNRLKDSDGSIGDTAHRQSVSDHNPDEEGRVPIHDADAINEVHAIDVDKDLRESDLTMEKVVQFLLGRCRSGAEKRLRYIIYNHRIWRASNGWVQETYDGPSPHTEHAHFSASYDPKNEASTASWHLEDIPVALTAEDKAWWLSTLEARLDQRAREDLEDLKDELAKLTKAVAFATGGGEHSPISDAAMNGYYPAEEGADRTVAWANWQRMQADLTAIREKLEEMTTPV